MGHYWDVIKTSWAQRNAENKPKLSRNEREFRAAAIEILETPASPSGRAFAALLIAFTLIAVVWSVFGRIDIHATLTGKIIPTDRVQVIEPLITGTVKALHVKPGQQVEAGALLVELDPTEQTAERTKLEQDLRASGLVSARLRRGLEAVIKGEPAEEAVLTVPAGTPNAMLALQQRVLFRSLAAYEAELRSIDAEVEQRRSERKRTEATAHERRELVKVMTERIDMLKTLAENGAGTRAQYLEGAQLLFEQRADMAAEEGRFAEIESAILTLEQRREERRAVFLEKATSELADNERRIAEVRQELRKAALRESQSRLFAPVAGIVQQLTVYTIGDVVQTGQQLMIVVPDDSRLEVEAMLPNKDKGFVRKGQTARIKIETFPFTKYGLIEGEILDVSNDAVPQSEGNPDSPLVFPVRVSLARDSIRADGRDVRLTPGMSVQTEVRIGERRVIEYMLTPLLRYQDEAMRER